jgi:ADP-ribosylglycohydrolase
MVSKEAVYRGCLLGLAVGDALGYAIDSKSWDEIAADYGPDGLRGYDLVNGYADVTSYTQMAAYAVNGLLLGLTRGQLRGKMAPFVRYIGLGLQEWSMGQHSYRTPERCHCWVAQIPELRRRRCMDTRMLDNLERGQIGSPEEPLNQFDTPSSLTVSIPVGLFFDPNRMQPDEIGRLGAEAVALTHGDPLTFLSGAALAYVIAGIVQDEETPLKEHFRQAAEVVAAQFGRTYPQAAELRHMVTRMLNLTNGRTLSHQQAMEHLKCTTAAEVLVGAMYACLCASEDFDRAMCIAVNHSGRSAAVGAVAGAILGAKLGETAIQDFYMDGLETADVIRELADDLLQGCPMAHKSRMFDDTWDQKYVQGKRVDQTGWAEE